MPSFLKPTPAPPAFGAGKVVPEKDASLLSKLVFNWLTPFLSVGFSRPLEKDDLWELPTPRLTNTLTNEIQSNFYARCPPEIRPHPVLARPSSEHDDRANIVDDKTDSSSIRKRPLMPSTESEPKSKRYDTSLLKALHTTFFWRWWSAGFMKLCADTLKTTSPLVTRALLAWLSAAFLHARVPAVQSARGIGYGIGLSFALFVMQEVSSLVCLLTYPFIHSLSTLSAPAHEPLHDDNDDDRVVGSHGYYWDDLPQELRLSGRARMEHSVGQVTTMISTDATRLDLSSAFIHKLRILTSIGGILDMRSVQLAYIDCVYSYPGSLWIAPIQIAIGIGLLVNNLGVSALVGLGVLIVGFPVQFILVRVMFHARKSGVEITDRRVRLTSEVLQGIRLVKFYAWEAFYAHRIGKLREDEVAKIRRIAIARASLISVVTVIPILASVLSFITYALSGHSLDPAIIFSSLQLFNIIRAPLIFFPLVLTAASDALVALGRIGTFLTAEELDEPFSINRKLRMSANSDRNGGGGGSGSGAGDLDSSGAPSRSSYGGADADAQAERVGVTRPCAIDVDADFTWETVGKVVGGKYADFGGSGAKGAKGAGKGGGEKDKKQGAGRIQSGKSRFGPLKLGRKSKPTGDDKLPTHRQSDVPESSKASTEKPPDAPADDADEPFALKDLRMQVPKGSFVAIVGRIGSGKSSLLQGLVGEMRKTRGKVAFGGTVAYVPQTAWIMNATLRDNILFGQDVDDERYNAVVDACSLQHDIDVLPNGDMTEIGEKGINLSGGQKARVSLARAAYSDADIILLDDPLSAVDAHVGNAILENCLLDGPLAKKTRVLVTHALHILSRVDFVYVIENGTIVERGTYNELLKDGLAFSRLMEEYGRQDEQKVSGDGGDNKDEVKGIAGPTGKKPDGMKASPALMTEEERNRGAVPTSVYTQYLKFAGGVVWAPVIILLLTLSQGASVGNNLFLGFWTAGSIRGFSQGDYMGVYSALGIAQAVFVFFTSFTFSLVGLYASLRLFRAALNGVLRSSVSFFDTTPMGRVMSRLSKDQDTLDTQLSMTMFQLLSTFSTVIGTVALVFYTFPYLGIIFLPLGILYYAVSIFYRRSSVETKRLDSLMRSALYASYTETLTGLATVRAYHEQDRFVKAADSGLDLENRAYYMTVSIQRWLSVRLDLFGNILILGIALFACGFRTTVNPSRIGVVLSYSLSITMVFSELVSQYAQNEQNMNAVERVLVYADLPPEGATTTPSDPPQSWPDQGNVRFENVHLKYREGLPLVLKGVSFEVAAGEKVGIVGRTGAGKSSLLQAMFRTVELNEGHIIVDGVDISTIGLDTLRHRLALVPQDSTLFLGTLRENLDPQNTRTDAEIISALRRAWLLPHDDNTSDPTAEAKFSLDAPVSDEGSNYSAGEKQLLALCRALLKGSRIIVLDEATSSVDVETDSKLQKTIQSEFSACTLLCIAHRLNTIVYYDRILVMDHGLVAEMDTPLNLFDKTDSIFRSLCDEAGLSRQDIERIRGVVESL